MNPKRALADYFTFSKKDRLFIYLLVGITGALLALPWLLPSAPPALAPLPDSVLRRPQPVATDPGRSPAADHYAPAYPGHAARTSEAEAWRSAPLFPFDPNTLDDAGWKKLGLSDRVIGTLLKYRDHGGRFRRPEDLTRIWSLPAGFVERVAPYVRIVGTPAGTAVQLPTRTVGHSERVPTRIAINEADSAAWEALPGIGAKLAGRILRYRERLGGFVSVDQVGEVWGLPDSTFRKIRPLLNGSIGSSPIRKFNLNNASRDELKVHPYIRWNLANALVQYREQHGPYRSVDDLRRLLLLPDSTLTKLLPYLSIN